jgi:hypothetical protein
MVTFTGGCACGAIRYEAKGDPVVMFACHCADCQRASGGGPSHEVIMPTAGFSLLKGNPQVYWVKADSGNRLGRSFCGICGTPVFVELKDRPEIRAISAGSLDDPNVFAPAIHIWARSALPWHQINATLPRHEKQPF